MCTFVFIHIFCVYPYLLCLFISFVFILKFSILFFSNKRVVEPKGIQQTALVSLQEKQSVIECASNFWRLAVCVIIGSHLLGVHTVHASRPGRTYTLLVH